MEIAITLDNEMTAPLHHQLYEELRGAILTGRLVAGERLPSTRALARSLGISRTTVTQSYEQLLGEGYLQAAIGSGTFVCRQLPDDLLRPAVVKRARSGQATRRAMRLSRYGESVAEAELYEPAGSEALINFKYGRPALDEFPLQLWRRLLARHCRAGELARLDYAADWLGHRPLREAIARYLARSRAVRCHSDQVIIVGGSQQAIDLVTRVLIERGETVAMEEPGYLGARRAFLAQGASLWPVPVDESGLVVEKLRARPAAQAKLVYVTPSHQFPTGAVLSLPRRLELLAWAQETGAVIVEDDYDSEYRYSGRPVPALQGLDQSESVIYVGTFSKVLFPALRVGYLVAPENLTRVLARAKWLADRQAPALEQCALTDFINEGHLERHIRRMRALYDRRRQMLVRALKQHLGERVTILGENAGMHLLARIRTRLADREVVRRAEQAGVGLLSARSNYLKPRRAGEFILGYANLSERQIQEGVRRLSSALGRELSRTAEKIACLKTQNE
jgi:GntR family transcriptional regulator/MocR family aminotransferase